MPFFANRGIVTLTLSYTGAGDIVPGALAYGGLRAYTAALASSNTALIDIVDSGNANLTTIHAVSSGGPNTSEISGWSGSGTKFITKISDQTGNGNHWLQATVANMPILTANVIGSLYGMQFDNASSQILITATGGPDQSQPFTFSYVAKRTGNTSALNSVLYQSNVIAGFDNTADAVFVYAGSLQGGIAASDNAFHAVQNIFDGASSDVVVNGSSNSVSPGPGALASASSIYFGGDNINRCVTGFIQEGGIWSIGFSAGQKTSMNSNQHTYWGF